MPLTYFQYRTSGGIIKYNNYNYLDNTMIEAIPNEEEDNTVKNNETNSEKIEDNEHSNEEYETELDLFFNYAIDQGIKINEGNNGIIVEVNLTDTDIPTKENPENTNKQNFSETTNNSSIAKIMKLYNTRDTVLGQQEYDKQLKAHSILTEAKKRGLNVADVPAPLLQHDVHLDEELSVKLQSYGAEVDTHAEVILMDRVEGKDIATTLYQTLLENHPDAQHLKHEHIEDWAFDELQEEISRIFFYEPENLTGGVHDRAAAQERVFRKNSVILQEEIAKLGIKINPNILDQIKNSIKAFRENGLGLLDAHERNFMVNGDITTSEAELSIIDFGDAIDKGEYPITEVDFEDDMDNIRHRSDYGVYYFLKEINDKIEIREKLEDERPWYMKDPKTAKVNTHIISKARAFSSKKESSFGLSQSRNPKENKVPILESAIETAINSFKETCSFDPQVIFNNFKNEKGKAILLKNEDSDVNTAWNENALFSGIMYKVFEQLENNELTTEQVREIVEKLQNHKKFKTLGTDTATKKFWTNMDLSQDLPTLLDTFKDKRKK